MVWRTARAIDQLLMQINNRFPIRDKSSDGTIGDDAHKSRDSDHNAWIRGRDGTDIVSGLDITHDPVHGLDNNILAQQLIDSRDRRIKYIIWNRKIIAGRDGPAPWTWRGYGGKNPHTHHIHISVEDTEERYDSAVDWQFKLAPTHAQVNAPVKAALPKLRNGMRGEPVQKLQRMLNEYGADLAVDGDFGPKTDRAVRLFQRQQGLAADGVVGVYTWEKLQQEKQ